MMNWIFAVIILLSVLIGGLNGRIGDVSNAAIEGGSTAVNLVLSLTGSLCLWSGVMKIAEASGLTKIIAKLLSPFTRFLFPGLPKSSAAHSAIAMNVTANLLGLGNAATPLGLQAMRLLSEENTTPATASNHMVTFVVLNTASIQLIPATVSALRLSHGAVSPMDILPATLITSVLSLAVGLIFAKLLQRLPFFSRKETDKCSSPNMPSPSSSAGL
ncbi:MAG: spore maturation protein A [Oscillospiraceae bacterium]|nr:spore maturation protein A [Oscillospiraceae bacterium]